MPRVLVVGAGVSGVAAARVLVDAGADVTVLDRGRAAGGRAASRTLHGRRVDLGASYLTVRDAGFRAVVADWVARGLAHPWTERFAVARADGWTTTSDGPLRYGTRAGVRTLVEDLAAALDVRTGRQVQRVGPGPSVDGERADAVVVALPDPQAERVLAPELVDERAAVAGRTWQPVLAVAAGYDACRWDLDGAFVDADAPGGDVVAWVADDGRRRGDVVASLDRLLAVGAPAWTHVHPWSCARPAAARDQPFHLGDAGVGLCGDGWGSPRLETAWVSGTALGRALADRF